AAVLRAAVAAALVDGDDGWSQDPSAAVGVAGDLDRGDRPDLGGVVAGRGPAGLVVGGVEADAGRFEGVDAGVAQGGAEPVGEGFAGDPVPHVDDRLDEGGAVG